MSTAETVTVTESTDDSVGTAGAPSPTGTGTGGSKRFRGWLGRGARGAFAFVRALPGRAVRGARAVAAAAQEWPKRAFMALGLAFVVFAAAAGLFAFLTHQQSAVDTAAAEARTTAEQNVTKLLSYDYRTVGGEVAQRAALTTGNFHDQYGSLIKDVVTPAAQQSQNVTKTQVVNSAPTEDVSPEHCSVMLFLNQTTTTAGKADPTFSGSRVRVGLDNVDGHWLVSDVTPI